MLNPRLAALAADDRITELRRGARRSSGSSSVPVAVGAPQPMPVRQRRRAPVGRPQRAVGWFLVSVGLRLALPRAGTGPAR